MCSECIQNQVHVYVLYVRSNYLLLIDKQEFSELIDSYSYGYRSYAIYIQVL